MPRTRSLAWSELKIGILAVSAIVLTSMLIFAVGGQAGFFWQQYPLKTRFANVQGLKSGAVVRLAGVEIGTVEEIEFVGAEVEVELRLQEEMRPRVTTTSTAKIGSLSLLGEPVIDITPGVGGTPIPDWGYIPSIGAGAQMADVTNTANRVLVEATKIIEDVRAGRGTVGRLFTDDALYREVNALVGAAADVATNIRHGRGTLGSLIRDPAAYRAAEASLRNLQQMTARINAGEGSLGQMLNDPTLARSLTTTTGNLDRITGRLSRGEGTAGKLLTDEALYARLDSMTGRLDQLIAALNAGEGTAGQLLKNRELYQNMSGAVGELRGLIGEIRKDPKKYLNVRVSIF
jgi:phospholipid/cholesterol/gamma-HCH transport system substrate-binding protein